MIPTAAFYQDPMVEMREAGVDNEHSGVYCTNCHAERTRLDAQWGGKLCQGCRRTEARERKATSVSGRSRQTALIAVGSTAGGRPPVALEDIDDLFAYVERVVLRRFPGHRDHEDYVAEGIAIAYKLHRDKWRRDLQPSFSKYLSTLLWQRLKDHWRTDIRQQAAGRRKAEGGFEALRVDSLDEMRETDVEIGQEDGRLAA